MPDDSAPVALTFVWGVELSETEGGVAVEGETAVVLPVGLRALLLVWRPFVGGCGDFAAAFLRLRGFFLTALAIS